jgi:3alpha(or 20beta)-hydroxysteroid dehydrogenase
MGRMDGKGALVTGAARGMGEATARLIAAEGGHVVVADRLEDQGRAVAESLGESAVFAQHDVADENSWAKVVASATEQFGGLDVLINNAAIWRTGRIEHETVEQFRAVLDVDLIGVFLGMRSVIAPMRLRGAGAIVNLSSTAGLVGVVEQGAYASAKWAVRGLTKVAALELANDRIRVNSVHPGAIDTPMIESLGLRRGEGLAPFAPMARIGIPEEVAAAVVFLASPDASYVTGAELYVDGGSMAGQVLDPDAIRASGASRDAALSK